MKFSLRRYALLLPIAALISLACLQGRGSPEAPQQVPNVANPQDEGPRLPNGKLQRDEILKAELGLDDNAIAQLRRENAI